MTDTTSLGARVLAALVPRHYPDLNALHRASGIAYSTLHAWKSGNSEPRWSAVQQLAELVHVDPWSLLLGASAPTNAQTLRQHPDWSHAVARARERYRGMPDAAYELAGDTASAQWPERLDEHAVYRLAEFWLQNAGDRKLIEAEGAAVRAEMASEDAARAKRPAR